MPYDLNNLTGDFKERSQEGKLPAGQMSAMEMSDRTLELINEKFDPLKNLGFELGENGAVPERDGVPRIFLMQPDANGIDRVVTLDQAGVKTGTREFWAQVQKGNVFAYPTGSADPVQIQAEIRPGNMPRAQFSAPLGTEEFHAAPAGHEYVEPNGFTRFMNRIFSGWRKTDCEIYRERQKLAGMSEKRGRGMDREQEELKAAEKRAAEREQKAADKKAYTTLERTTGYKEKGKEFYRDLVAPQPKYHPEHSRTEGNDKGFYSKEEFESLKPIDKNIGDYTVGGQNLSVDEYCGLVTACSFDTKFMDEGFKHDSNFDETLVPAMVNAGYSEKDAKQIIIGSYSTMISDDIMKGDLRVNQGVQLQPTVNPARGMAFEILDEYKNGNKDRLAEKIAEGVKITAACTDQYVRVPQNGAFNHFEFTAALTDLMDRDSELKDLAMKKGMKQEDLDAVRGMREYSRLDSKRGAAQTAIARAVAEGKELSYQEKMQYAKDILSANIMESRLFADNREHEEKGKAIDAEHNRMKSEAEKDGLIVNEEMKDEWKKSPEGRPMPPKGKFYTDQVVTIMGGRDAEFNKHPESVFDFNDPEAMQGCREIAEEIVNAKGLADMSVQDLNKAMNSPTSMFQGFKLVEEANKAAEKIADQKRRELLGIDEPELGDNEILNNAMNLGKKAPKQKEGPKEPQAGGPVA